VRCSNVVSIAVIPCSIRAPVCRSTQCAGHFEHDVDTSVGTSREKASGNTNVIGI
jgi:hypothetical protein